MYIFKRKNILPHTNVYTRLGVSGVHGVGVFAIKDIPMGTNIFEGDIVEMEWIDKKIVDDIADASLKKLYTDFSVLKNGKYGCPKNFNSITPGWYINEPQMGISPNVKCNENYEFFATKDIKMNEELFADYSTFSEHIDRY